MTRQHPVFISYARKSNQVHAHALWLALGGANGLAFLDTSDIEAGQRFPKALGDALLAARIVVVFADDAYFRSWYCLRELRIALAPFEVAMQGDANDGERERALTHVMLVLPAGESTPPDIERLPAALRHRHALRANATNALRALVEQQLESPQRSLGEQLRELNAADAVIATFLEEASLPAPGQLASIRTYPAQIEMSIGDRFVGRTDDLWRIDFHLRTLRGEPASAAALTGALEAAGGFGKTRIALEYLHRFGPLYFRGGLFWLNADADAGSLERQFHGMLKSIHPATPPLDDFRQTKRDAFAELGRAFHELNTTQPVLFVIDNVPEGDGTTAPLSLNTWCPALGKVTVIATSRRRLSSEAHTMSLPVDELAGDAAVQLLTNGIKSVKTSRDSWRSIAAWVGHLPVALELLNSALQQGAISPAELLQRSRDSGTTEELDQLANALCGLVPAGSARGVSQALMISYERLPKEARNAACLLAHLAAEPIPVEIVEALSISAANRAALITHSFITKLGPTSGDYFGKMHRVVADFVRTRSSDKLADARTANGAATKVYDDARKAFLRATPDAELRAGDGTNAEFAFTLIKASIATMNDQTDLMIATAPHTLRSQELLDAMTGFRRGLCGILN